MAKKDHGLGKGLDSIFGSTGSERHFKTAAEKKKEEENVSKDTETNKNKEKEQRRDLTKRILNKDEKNQNEADEMVTKMLGHGQDSRESVEFGTLNEANKKDYSEAGESKAVESTDHSVVKEAFSESDRIQDAAEKQTEENYQSEATNHSSVKDQITVESQNSAARQNKAGDQQELRENTETAQKDTCVNDDKTLESERTGIESAVITTMESIDPEGTEQERQRENENPQAIGEMSISLIQPNLNQPRKNFNEAELSELADSIRQYGVIQPLIVQKNGPVYEIIAGERRWRAARMAGLKSVPVIIRSLDKKTASEIAIIENIQRSDLNPVEEAYAYQSLIEQYNLTQEEVAEKVSKNRSTITNSLRLLKLEPEILALLRDGRISQGHARALLGIEDPELRKTIAERCAKENLSVREIERLARNGRKNDNQEQGNFEDEEIKRLKAVYKDLEQKMQASLGTKVVIHPKDSSKGRLEIEYYSQDELDRIYRILNSADRLEEKLS